MQYVANKDMLVEGDIVRKAGEIVPEATSWKNVDTYISMGLITAVPDELLSIKEEIEILKIEIEEIKQRLDSLTAKKTAQRSN